MSQRLFNLTPFLQEAGIANKPLALGSASFFAEGGSAFSEVVPGSEQEVCFFCGSEKKEKNGGGGGYLEPIAKRSVELASILRTNDDYVKELLGRKCPSYFLIGGCENGHRYAKELYCGREWCPVCGEEWSAAHQRRFARWLGKAFQVESMGYFVFTIPEELRGKYRTKKALRELGHWIQELLKAFGYSRGLRRWHFFGDKSTKWNPHLNLIVDGGYLRLGIMAAIKRAYASKLGVDVVDVNYQYVRSPAKKVHRLKYVTRATFLDYEWDTEMALELYGFRNQLWWGSKLWNEESLWGLDDLEGKDRAELENDEGEIDLAAVKSLESGNCPKCGEPIDWGKVEPIEMLESMEKRLLGAGYWELEDARPPP